MKNQKEEMEEKQTIRHVGIEISKLIIVLKKYKI